jgi:AAA domain
MLSGCGWAAVGAQVPAVSAAIAVRGLGAYCAPESDYLPGGHVVSDRRIAAVKRVLLTGMSGTGKSSVIGALSARGFKAVDTDDGWCEPWPDGRQRWREDAIGRLLDAEDAEVLFVAGCEENQVRFHPRFDLIILLSAPAGVLAERLASRTENSFGRGPGELERILDDLQGVEPLLRKAATHEIRTTMPLDDVVAEILHLAGALA